MTVVALAEQTVTALPVTAHLHFWEGDDVFLILDVTDPNGAPADLSDAEPRSQLRSSPDSPDVLAEFETAVLGNLIHLHLPSTATAGLAAVDCPVWDCQVTIDGYVTTLAAGRIVVVPEVTR